MKSKIAIMRGSTRINSRKTRETPCSIVPIVSERILCLGLVTHHHALSRPRGLVKVLRPAL